jgi:hypothetical protein
MNPYYWTVYEWETFAIVFGLTMLLLPGWCLMQAVWSVSMHKLKQGNPITKQRIAFVIAHPDDESM